MVAPVVPTAPVAPEALKLPEALRLLPVRLLVVAWTPVLLPESPAPVGPYEVVPVAP